MMDRKTILELARQTGFSIQYTNNEEHIWGGEFETKKLELFAELVLNNVIETSDDLTFRLRKRAEIRRQIPSRKSVQNNEPDRIADLLEEAADAIEHLEKVKDLHRDAHRKCVELSRKDFS
jgi:hypothetical protein